MAAGSGSRTPARWRPSGVRGWIGHQFARYPAQAFPKRMMSRFRTPSSVVAAEPALTPRLEGAIENVATGLLTEANQKPNVVDGDESQGQHVLNHKEMAQVAARVGRACFAVTAWVERLDRSFQRRTLYINPSGRKPGGTVAAVARWRHTVEQVHTPCDPLHQIGWKSDSHKITRDLPRKLRTEVLQDAVHDGLGLAYRETANGNAGPRTAFQRPFEGTHA